MNIMNKSSVKNLDDIKVDMNKMLIDPNLPEINI